MKNCRLCNISKPLESYYKGCGTCKICKCAQVRKHRATHDSVRIYDKNRSMLPHRVALRKHICSTWRKENPEKYKAQTILNNALRDKKIIKPDTCSVCNCATRIYGHHEDYSKPLEVMWMCQRCHKLHHIKETIMAKTSTMKSTTKAPTAGVKPLATPPANNNMVIGGTVLALNDQTLKSVAVLAASIMFSAPQFATQTNPTNILGLADLMYKYFINEVKIDTPSTEAKEPEAPKFG